jgi:hypothetical protein
MCMRLHSKDDLVEGSSAIGSTAVAWNFVFFDLKLVVIRNLSILLNISSRVDHNVLLAIDGDDFGDAGGLKRQWGERNESTIKGK